MAIDDTSGFAGESTDHSGKGWRFRAHLLTSTPLAALQADGWIEQTGERPEVGETGGEWLSVEEEHHEGPSRPSQFGPVEADGGDVLQFLIAFRTMVETRLTEEQYQQAARDIAARFPDLARQATALLND
jgi:hypothetical protein